MQADGTLAELARVEHPVNRRERVDGTRILRIDLDSVGGTQIAGARVDALVQDLVVLHAETADGRGHPAILVAMVVYRAGLSHFPADGNEFVERRLVDEIARVMLGVPGEVGRERFRGNDSVLQEGEHITRFVERSLRELAQT